MSVDGFTVQVPCGLMVDGASVPRLLWWMYPPDGLYRAAALVHNFLYQTLGCRKTVPLPLSRAESDGIFHAILMRTIGVTVHTARLMWSAVRLGGWLPWKRSAGVPRIEPLRYQIS